MKRTIRAAAFCLILLAVGSFFLIHTSAAKDDPIAALLKLPAPAPHNPLSPNVATQSNRPMRRTSDQKPPEDNGPIDELIEYWTHAPSIRGNPLNAGRKPSERVLERLTAEMPNNPELAVKLLGVLPDSKEVADIIKALYDRAGTDGGPDANQKRVLGVWLVQNSAYFSQDLERTVRQTRDSNDYVDITTENNLLSLTRHDFDRAGPIVNQLYGDPSQPVSRVLATWALYRHALDTDAVGDIDRYRSELMRLVEDKNQPDGVRDKANDALTHERDFPGRDDWTYSLFEDKSLVEMPRFTMLTTLFMYTPPDKHVPKLIDLVEKSPNATARSGAVRILMSILQGGSVGPEVQRQIVECMLPTLDDPKWVKISADDRMAVVNALAEIQMLESVPGLIRIMDERAAPVKAISRDPGEPDIFRPNSNANAGGRSVISNSANVAGVFERQVEEYPFRYAAVAALGRQKDGRAVPALRRVLNEVNDYRSFGVVSAILACGGFTISEQMDALEDQAKGVRTEIDEAETMSGTANMIGAEEIQGRRNFSGFSIANRAAMGPAVNAPVRSGPLSAANIKAMIGHLLTDSDVISDQLARALVDRIDSLDKRDEGLAQAYRKMILKWQNAVINGLLLRDVIRGRADADAIVRLLSQRKELREKQSADVSDLRNGRPAANGIWACLEEDSAAYDSILDAKDVDAKIAMLACARLIRAPLQVRQVSPLLKSENKTLAMAAELFLESEDSPEARSIVLALHPNEAKILGATTAFFAGNARAGSQMLPDLFKSVNAEGAGEGLGISQGALDAFEKKLQDEVKTDKGLQGVYAYDRNYVRIYQDKVVYSWEEDDSRYHERPLSKDEFDRIKSYLASNRVDELLPFLSECNEEQTCGQAELLMLSRTGGRRVYYTGTEPRFFTGLDKVFEELRQNPGVLKYALSKEIPGLEIVLADADLDAETVCKPGDDLLVLVTSQAVRKKVETELEDASEALGEDPSPRTPEFYRLREESMYKMREQREYEGFTWHKIAGAELGDEVAQPPGFDFIPVRDSAPVRSPQEAWKARTSDFELRAGYNGLYKIVRGKPVKFLDGAFKGAVVTPNGRWAVVTRLDEDGAALIRINLLTKKVYPVESAELGDYSAIAYLPAINKVLLLARDWGGSDDESEARDEENGHDLYTDSLMLLDPETGAFSPANGEFRPLVQQTFRPLQKASKASESWAALPDRQKNETLVGIYDTNQLVFKTVLRVPKILFNSMNMWVDETAGKVYFIYRGHLLSLPLNKAK